MARLTLAQARCLTAAKVTPRGGAGVAPPTEGMDRFGDCNCLWPERQELDHGVRERALEPNADDVRHIAAPANIIGDHEAWPSPGQRFPILRERQQDRLVLKGGIATRCRANSSLFGLGSGVWTRDVSKAHRLAKRIRAGSVWVNCYQAMDPAVPFGGYKMSGYGRESGLQQLEEYLNVKAVWIKTT